MVPFIYCRVSPSPISVSNWGLPMRAYCSLPISEQKAKYYHHLRTAVDAVRQACRLCVNVQRSLLSSDEKIIQKMDQTPVTIADFGVQALVSLELSLKFPSIPLVAEEDSGFVRENNLVDAVSKAVIENSTRTQSELNNDVILKAIDRGGRDAFLCGPEPATYWVLDPIDGTRGFVKGGDALYVVGLALVVEGEIVLGVMGCPNWKGDESKNSDDEFNNTDSKSGIIMISHVDCGTWRSRLSSSQQYVAIDWIRCFVDNCQEIHKGKFCIPESQTWESFPLSKKFTAITHTGVIHKNQVLLLPTCCGSLCKYLMVASGRASAFILRTKSSTSVKVWDHAVGVLCINEARGKVSDWNGKELDFAGDRLQRRVLFPFRGIVVANDRLHHLILEAIVFD